MFRDAIRSIDDSTSMLPRAAGGGRSKLRTVNCASYPLTTTLLH